MVFPTFIMRWAQGQASVTEGYLVRSGKHSLLAHGHPDAGNPGSAPGILFFHHCVVDYRQGWAGATADLSEHLALGSLGFP